MVRLSTVGSFWLEDESVQISITGTWLRDYGFTEDTKIVIDVEDGVIVIKRVDEEV